MPHILNVSLHGRPVGTITNSASDQNVFAFADEYAADPERPVVSLGFYNGERELIEAVRSSKVRLHPFFANLLPEGHLRRYLAERARVHPARDFPLLWLTGDDLPGAVVVSHTEKRTVPADSRASDVVAPDVEADPAILKFSLAGVQLKFSAIREADGGVTIPVHGRDGNWILKMPSATYRNVPENEYSMLGLAREVGIDVPEIHLVDASKVSNMPPEVRTDLGRAMVIKRFDRDGRNRVHIEDFNQIFGQYPEDKYKNASYGNMLRSMWAVLGEKSVREFVGRLIFNVAIGNGDMHLKNWSVIYRDGKTPELAPAYDYLSSIIYLPNDKLALSIAGSKEWSDVSAEQLERWARKSGVPRGIVLGAARTMAEKIHDSWPRFKKTAELDARELKKIDSHMATIPLLSGDRTYAVAAAGPTAPAEDQPEIA